MRGRLKMLRVGQSGIFRRPLYNFWFECADEMFFSPISALPYHPPSLNCNDTLKKGIQIWHV